LVDPAVENFRVRYAGVGRAAGGAADAGDKFG
jgi:hypothetical protein